MYKNETTYKKMSELPDEVREKIYSLRLQSDLDIPIDEYIEQFCVVLVDDCLYYTNDDFSRIIVDEFKKNDKNGLAFKKIALPTAVVKDGYVIKNRYGCLDKVEV